jgi:hypothetical protein
VPAAAATCANGVPDETFVKALVASAWVVYWATVKHAVSKMDRLALKYLIKPAVVSAPDKWPSRSPTVASKVAVCVTNDAGMVARTTGPVRVGAGPQVTLVLGTWDTSDIVWEIWVDSSERAASTSLAVARRPRCAARLATITWLISVST